MTPDHRVAKVWLHGYGLLGQSVWLQRNLFKERKSLAQILTINFLAPHFCWISCVVDSFAIHYIHSCLPYSSIRRRERNSILLSITHCENIGILFSFFNKWGNRIPCGMYVLLIPVNVERKKVSKSAFFVTFIFDCAADINNRVLELAVVISVAYSIFLWSYVTFLVKDHDCYLCRCLNICIHFPVALCRRQMSGPC